MVKHCGLNLLERLQDGNFDELALYDWVRNENFDYIKATIEGLDKVIDPELFDIIVTQMEFLLFQYSNEMAFKKDTYLEILEKAILIASRHREYKEYVEQLFFSNYYRIRLCCYVNLDLNLTIRELSKNESDEIQKIVSIRDEFNRIWNTEIDKYAKERIRWFEKMINVGAISIIKEPFADNAYCSFFEIEFVSFKKNDVFYFMEDKIINPYILNQMYENGELRFKEGVRLPECFMTEKGKKHIRVRRKENTTPNSKRSFDELYQVII